LVPQSRTGLTAGCACSSPGRSLPPSICTG
jgi:hypothetical protein